MNMKAAVKYQLNEFKYSVIIFYIVIASILTFTFILLFATRSPGETNGFELATLLFLFVCGSNSFKENFRFFLQNGSSRKKLFDSQMLSMLVVAVGMSVIDRGICVVGQGVASISGKSTYRGILEIVYSSHADKVGSMRMNLESLLFFTVAYATVFLVGYFITVASYRMNKVGTITASVGIPVFLFMGIPFLEVFVTHGAIVNAIGHAFRFAFGFDNGGNPYFGLATCMIVAIVFAGLSWLLMRRATIKE